MNVIQAILFLARRHRHHPPWIDDWDRGSARRSRAPQRRLTPHRRTSVDLHLGLPVVGVVSSRFGRRLDPISHVGKFHGGIDISARRGSPVWSLADGTVTWAGLQGGYGLVVIIAHPDGREARYAHLDSILVHRGQTVGAGDTIGTVGSTGRSTAPHLHFEVREGGRAIDPVG
jgi:murein DD-endopeptidase MepM/ murein hydrolase activator NlpD